MERDKKYRCIFLFLAAHFIQNFLELWSSQEYLLLCSMFHSCLNFDDAKEACYSIIEFVYYFKVVWYSTNTPFCCRGVGKAEEQPDNRLRPSSSNGEPPRILIYITICNFS